MCGISLPTPALGEFSPIGGRYRCELHSVHHRQNDDDSYRDGNNGAPFSRLERL